jgi:predicted small lipoprotein YifL
MRTAVLVAAGACLLLAACGQKGPLYLPDQKPAVVPSPAPPAATPAGTDTSPANPKKKTDEADAGDTPAPR